MITIIDILAHHNHWAVKRLIRECRALDEAQLHERFEIGLGTLHDTILHIIAAMRRWADRIGDRELRPSLRLGERRYSLDELESLFDEASADLHCVVSKVRAEKRIDELMTASAKDWGPFTFKRGSAIVHIYTHGMYHLAQATNMLRRLGVTNLPELSAIDAELESDLMTFAQQSGE